MKTSPEVQAVNLLVEVFDLKTDFQYDDWSLEQIMAWWYGYGLGAQQGKDNDE